MPFAIAHITSISLLTSATWSETRPEPASANRNKQLERPGLADSQSWSFVPSVVVHAAFSECTNILVPRAVGVEAKPFSAFVDNRMLKAHPSVKHHGDNGSA